MTTAIRRRRGTTTQHATFTGLEGEVTVDTTKETLVVHDGATAGGFPLLREDLSNNSNVATLNGIQTFSGAKTFSAAATFSAGSAAAPAITTTGDSNTGIFFPAADTIAFSEGGVESMRLNASGNLGIGVTPSAWFSTWKAIQVGASGALSSRSDVFGTTLSQNSFINSAGNFAYIGTAAASRYSLIGAEHQWFTAPSGTAGAAISFTQAMTLSVNGNLSIGTTATDIAKIYTVTTAAGLDNYRMADENSSVASGIRAVGDAIAFRTVNAERMRLDASGNLGIGTSSPGARLDVSSSSGNNAIISRSTAAQNASVQIAGNGNTPGTSSFDLIQDNTFAYVYQRDSKPLLFGTSNTERARIDASGNLIQSAPTTPPTLSTNGTMVFNLTSNTNLRISVRGSDGVTRTANITLA